MSFCLQCERSFINIINSKSCKVDFWKQLINPVLHLSCQMYSLQKKKKKATLISKIPHSSCLFLTEVFRSERFCSPFSPHLSDLVNFNPPFFFAFRRLCWPLLEWTGWISIHKSNSRVVSRSPTENFRSRQQPHVIQNVCPRRMQISTVWAVNIKNIKGNFFIR